MTDQFRYAKIDRAEQPHDDHCKRDEFDLRFTPSCRECGYLMYAQLLLERDRTLYSRISNSVNGGRLGDIRDEFSRDHRTLQQGVVRSIIRPILEQLAEDHENGYFDLRNEGACEFAARAIEANKSAHLPLI